MSNGDEWTYFEMNGYRKNIRETRRIRINQAINYFNQGNLIEVFDILRR